MASETTVGSIVGFLRLDASQWNSTLAEAGAAAERLGNSDPNVEVHADTGQALAALATVQGESDHIDGQSPTIHPDVDNTSFERGISQSKRGMGALVQAALLIGPALIPAAGAVAGLGLALGGLGVAGVLAIVGVKNALKNGSDAGIEFQNGINSLKGDLDLLAATAAGGILDGFSGVVTDLHGKMPQIQNGIGALSSELGDVMRPAADGITSAFIELTPLMSDVAGYAIRGANAFDQWAQGDGLQKFGGYAMAVLPDVLDDIGQLVELAGNVVGAFAGWGGGVLSLLGTLASLLNSLPDGVLTVVANGGLAIYSAFKGFGLLKSLVGGFGTALGGMAANMERVGATQAAARLQGVAGGLRAVGSAGSIANMAVGGISAVLGVAIFAWSLYKQKQQQAKAAQEAMTQAIQEDSGALGENSQKVIAKTIADGDMIGKAKELGISQDLLTQAITRGGPALDEVNQKITENGTVSRTSSGAAKNLAGDQTRLSDKAASLKDGLGKLNGQIKNGKKEYDANKLAAKALGAQLDSNVGSLSSVELAHISATNATKDQKKAIDDLNKSIQDEISKQLQLQGGLTGIGSAQNQLVQTLKKTKSSTDEFTKSGASNRQGIEQSVGAIQQYMQTQEKNGKTTAQATSTYKSQAAELLNTIARTDGAKSSTYKYAEQLLKLPKDVSTKVGTEGVGVSVSQLKGMQDVADALGVTRIAVPASTPNAKNVTTLLNNMSDAALSADQKSVNIKTASPHAVVDKLRLEGITGAAVAADGKSVNVPTRTLNQPRTVREIQDVLSKTKDKSMTITAKENRLGHVIGQLDYIAGSAHDRSFTVSATYITSRITRVQEQLSRSPRPYAVGTSNATAGMHLVGERGPELVMGPQVANLAAGSVVLNHQDTMRTLAGDRGPVMRATGSSGGGAVSLDPASRALIHKLIEASRAVAAASAAAVQSMPAAVSDGMAARDRISAQRVRTQSRVGIS